MFSQCGVLMLSCLTMWWCIATNPLSAVVELSQMSSLETADLSNRHELCHVDGDGLVSLKLQINTCIDGGSLPCHKLDGLHFSRDSNCRLAIANYSTGITLPPTP